jgi:hypothetical protein
MSAIMTELNVPGLMVNIPDFSLANVLNLNEPLDINLDYNFDSADNKFSVDDLKYSVAIEY